MNALAPSTPASTPSFLRELAQVVGVCLDAHGSGVAVEYKAFRAFTQTSLTEPLRGPGRYRQYRFRVVPSLPGAADGRDRRSGPVAHGDELTSSACREDHAVSSATLASPSRERSACKGPRARRRQCASDRVGPRKNNFPFSGGAQGVVPSWQSRVAGDGQLADHRVGNPDALLVSFANEACPQTEPGRRARRADVVDDGLVAVQGTT